MKKEDAVIIYLIHLLNKRRIIPTRKKVQKLIGLLKLDGLSLPFKFILYHYGPYSPELQNNLDNLVKSGMISEFSWLNRFMNISFGYEVKGKIVHLAEKVLDDETKNKIKKIVDNYGKYSGEELAIMILEKLNMSVEDKIKRFGQVIIE